MDSEYSLKKIIPEPEKPVEEKKSNPIISTTSLREKEVQNKEDGIPESVKYFSVEGWGELLIDPRLDVYNLAPKIVHIEKFLSSKISELGAKDSSESRNQLLKELEKSLKLSDFHTPHHRIERVYNIIKYMDEFEEERNRRSSLIFSMNKKFKK